MPNKTIITIAVLTYRRPQSLMCTLQSLYVLQEPENVDLRLLIVDNDAVCSAASMVEAYQYLSPWPVTYAVAPVRGIPFARNKALEEAMDSDFIAFIDDDDIADSKWIQTLYETLLKYGAEVVAGCMRYRFPTGHERLATLDLFADIATATGAQLPSAWSGNVLFSAKLYREWGLRFDTDFRFCGGSDHHFFAMAGKRSARIIMCREAIIYSDISQQRTKRRWLVRRSLRNGATRSIADRKINGLRYAFGQACCSVSSGVPYALRLMRGSIKGEVLTIHPFLAICFIAGRICGLVGLTPQEYR